jgi:FHS family Na+ dependent glucose MFS transporter 1
MNPSDPRNAVRQTAGYFIIYVGIGLILSSLGSALPSFANQTGSTLAQLGAVFTSLSLGRILGAFTLGRYFDHRPAHPFMALLLAVMAGLLAAAPLLPGLGLLLAAFFLIGIAWGGLDVSTNTLLAWIWDERSGPFLSGLHLFFGVGAIAAPFVINASIGFNATVRLAYWLFAALLVADAAWLLLIPSPSIRVPVPQAQSRGAQGLFVAGVVVLIALVIGEETAFSGWIFSYMRTTGLAQQDQAILLNSLFWVALSVSRLVSVPAQRWFSPQRILTFDLVGCVLAVGLILLAPRSPAVVWAGTMLLGFSIATVFPLLIWFTQQHVPLTGRITSLLMIGDGIGGMTFPWLAGVLFERVSPTALIWQAFASLALALVLYLALSAGRRQPKNIAI